jgi:UDP-N-acetylglucosamine--N-acetylmuramyl-(pentapeptide) pyrophosphoryl-undecaprenol N-acetylglucosamine transferase
LKGLAVSLFHCYSIALFINLNDSVMSRKTHTALIMAGGTGGHVFPALAVAEKLQQQGWHVEWLGTEKGIESTLVPKAGIHLNVLSVKGLRGKGKLSLLFAPFMLLFAIGQAVAVLVKVKPDVVLGLGGFASGPGGIAAKLLFKPLCIHEQNAYAGMTNRYLSKVANKVMQAFSGAFKNAEVVGNPVRQSIVDLSAPEAYEQSREIKILVVGGSLGALAINQIVPEAAKLLIDQGLTLNITHQCGVKHTEKTEEFYDKAKVAGNVVSFIDDMAKAYRNADLVICRSGALTVSEISAAGVAAIFVPFPFAVDDHQTANAQWLVNQGSGVIMQQKELTPKLLTEQIQTLLLRNTLNEFRRLAYLQRLPDAADRVAQVCIELGEK